jgi:hypothetical protein
MKTVWVLAHDNTFEQRMVETGTENKYWIEITSGLKLGRYSCYRRCLFNPLSAILTATVQTSTEVQQIENNL